MRYVTALEALRLPRNKLQDGQWFPQGTRVIRLKNGLVTSVGAEFYHSHKKGGVKCQRESCLPSSKEQGRRTLLWVKKCACLFLLALLVLLGTSLLGIGFVALLVLAALTGKVWVSLERRWEREWSHEHQQTTIGVGQHPVHSE